MIALKYGPYSPSRLDTANCFYAFYRLYVDPESKNRVKIHTLAQDRGSAVHDILERITQILCGNPNAVFTDTQIHEWVVSSISKYPAAYQEITDIINMVKLYIRKPPQMLTSDAQTELRLALKYTDKGFVECSYDSPDAAVRGRADIFMISDDTTIGLVYDHKTQPNIEEADTFQLGFYAWVISKIYPFLSEIRTVLHFVRYGVYSEPYVWTKEQLAQVEDEILTRMSIIESKTTWEPVPHKNCQYCPFIGDCPAMKEFVEILPDGNYRVSSNNLKILGDTDKAVKLAGFINVMEEAMKIAKANLRDHVSKSSPIAIPGKVFEFRDSEEINWDKVNQSLKNDVCAIFKKHEVDPIKYMGFSQTASKALWLLEDNPVLVRELSNFLPRKVSTKFSGYKV